MLPTPHPSSSRGGAPPSSPNYRPGGKQVPRAHTCSSSGPPSVDPLPLPQTRPPTPSSLTSDLCSGVPVTTPQSALCLTSPELSCPSSRNPGALHAPSWRLIPWKSPTHWASRPWSLHQGSCGAGPPQPVSGPLTVLPVSLRGSLPSAGPPGAQFLPHPLYQPHLHPSPVSQPRAWLPASWGKSSGWKGIQQLQPRSAPPPSSGSHAAPPRPGPA